MEEQIQKKTRRTPEQRAAAIDEKIEAKRQAIAQIEEKRAKAMTEYDEKVAAVNNEIKKLEEKKKAILAPKPPRKTKKQKIQEILKAAEKAGMRPEEIAERLGLNKAEE